jgi:O-methyltransferase
MKTAVIAGAEMERTMGFAKRLVLSLIEKCGYRVTRFDDVSQFPPDFDSSMQEIVKFVQPYTMTSAERVFTLRQSVQHIIDHDIPGDIVECGVWKGGSMMAVARTLLDMGVSDRHLYLFDTFEGMPEPTNVDVNAEGQTAVDLLSSQDDAINREALCVSLEEVKRNLQFTKYPTSFLHFVKGPVEKTIPQHAPEKIALLRLDTDWYESTYHEMCHLYPRLSPGGILIIDDYGYWTGAKMAVDQYYAEQRLKPFLGRIDATARICIKER